MDPVERVLERFPDVKRNGHGWMVHCPVPGHGKGRGDHSPSLHIDEGADGQALLHCFAGCSREDVLNAVGLTDSDLFPLPQAARNGGAKKTRYEIRNTKGKLEAIHIRTDNADGTKDVTWERPDGNKGLYGRRVSKLPLYGSEMLGMKGTDGMPVVVCEGEKAADALRDRDVLALGTVTGAGHTPSPVALECLRDRDVILWPDNDKPGRAHMERLAKALQGLARSVRYFDWPDAPPKGDAADWTGTTEELADALHAASEWKPEEPGFPKIITAADLLAAEMPKISWIVPDVLPEGVTLLAGKPKVGKSWMALGMAVAVSTGGVALGTKPVEQGEVLYLALEDNLRRLQRRLRKLLPGGVAPSGLHIATGWPRLDEGGTEALDAWMHEHPGCRLVVVDVLKKIRPRVGGIRSMYDADYEALEPLIPMAAEHGVSILVVHHLRKLDADDPMDTISGSLGLSGGADGYLVLKKDRQAGTVLYGNGRDIEEPAELALKWDADTAGWTIAGDAEAYRMNELRAGIIGALEANGEPMTPTEVANALDRPFNTVKQRMWQMSKDGLLISRDGHYSVHDHNPHNRVTEESRGGYGVTPVMGYADDTVGLFDD